MADDWLDAPAVSSQGRVLAVIATELKEILQGPAIGMCAGPKLIYQGWAQLIAGLSAVPLWRVIQLPAVIQIITFTLMLSLSLSLSPLR